LQEELAATKAKLKLSERQLAEERAESARLAARLANAAAFLAATEQHLAAAQQKLKALTQELDRARRYLAHLGHDPGECCTAQRQRPALCVQWHAAPAAACCRQCWMMYAPRLPLRLLCCR
jgi:septal ring factor EnvC (AmiA/AmiB activator)